LLAFFLQSGDSGADPTKYPQFAQQDLPKAMTPEFIYLDRLVDEIVNGKRPLIVDVRSGEEYDQSHIKGSTSIPLDKIPLHLADIPKDRLVVFY
jgi:hypothetical protein